jgi:hypothetical protein
MATVVYDGVGGKGTLFKGIKFFLVQRLPTRDRWKALVKVCTRFLESMRASLHWCSQMAGKSF